MPRRPPEYRNVHAAADKIEPRLARATVKAMDTVRTKVPVRAIAQALEKRDLQTVRRIIEELDIEDALVPSTNILTDAFNKGGKTGAEAVPDREVPDEG